MSPWPSLQMLVEAKNRLRPVTTTVLVDCRDCSLWFRSKLCEIHEFTAPKGRVCGAEWDIRHQDGYIVLPPRAGNTPPGDVYGWSIERSSATICSNIKYLYGRCPKCSAETAPHESDLIHAAAIAIQCVWRSFHYRRIHGAAWELTYWPFATRGWPNEHILEDGATQIQRLWRGFQGRKKATYFRCCRNFNLSYRSVAVPRTVGDYKDERFPPPGRLVRQTAETDDEREHLEWTEID